MDKYYLAVTSKIPEKKSGRLEDWMIKDAKKEYVENCKRI